MNTFKGPEDLCFHFSLRIFYEVPQRHNNEGWTLQSREIVYGWLRRPVLRLGLKVFVGKTEAVFKMLGWERIKIRNVVTRERAYSRSNRRNETKNEQRCVNSSSHMNHNTFRRYPDPRTLLMS